MIDWVKNPGDLQHDAWSTYELGPLPTASPGEGIAADMTGDGFVDIVALAYWNGGDGERGLYLLENPM